MLSDNFKVIILIAVLGLLIYLIYNNNAVKNDGALSEEVIGDEDENDAEMQSEESRHIRFDEGDTQEDGEVAQCQGRSEEEQLESEIEKEISQDTIDDSGSGEASGINKNTWLERKFKTRNMSRCGYKRSNFSGANRGKLPGPAQWDEFFDQNNDVIKGGQSGRNDTFAPSDLTNSNLAEFTSREKFGKKVPCGSNQNCDPEELFDLDKYLPQEVNDNWFDVQPEPISVKNRHLINVTKPIGINTIANSLRNASHDLRGTIACPKFVVSPWLQSTIEPDLNIKPLF